MPVTIGGYVESAVLLAALILIVTALALTSRRRTARPRHLVFIGIGAALAIISFPLGSAPDGKPAALAAGALAACVIFALFVALARRESKDRKGR